MIIKYTNFERALEVLDEVWPTDETWTPDDIARRSRAVSDDVMNAIMRDGEDADAVEWKLPRKNPVLVKFDCEYDWATDTYTVTFR